MRIRKGHRGVVPRPGSADRSSSAHEGFPKHARVLDGPKHEVNHGACISGDTPVLLAAAPATTHQESLERANGAETERAERDPERKRLSADGYSRIRRPQISEGLGLSISSIIQAGKGSPRSNSASAPESVVTSDTSVTAKGASTDCSPSEAMVAPMDQLPTLLLQSLTRVCTAAGNAGLTPKEAVAKITEQRLPGLNKQGGERLIVQVAKSFRGSPAFYEERGRYFIHQDSSPKRSDSGNSSSKAELPSSHNSEIETAIEAARQLQNLQMFPDTVGFGRHEEKAAERRIGTSRSKSKASSSNEQAGPRCNRDDGKGWRCFRPAESGFSLCKYHRDQIRRAELRRRRSKNKSTEQGPVKVPNSPKEVVNVKIPEAEIVDPIESSDDAQQPDQKRPRFVQKAKLLKSIL